MGHVVHVVDRRGDVEARHRRRLPADLSRSRRDIAVLEHAARARHLTIDPVADPAEVLPEVLAAGVVLDHVQTKVGRSRASRSRDRRVVEQPTQPSALRSGIDVRAVELGGTRPGSRSSPAHGRTCTVPRSRLRWWPTPLQVRGAPRRDSHTRQKIPWSAESAHPRFQASGTRRQTSETARRPSARGRPAESRPAPRRSHRPRTGGRERRRTRPRAPACRHGRRRQAAYPRWVSTWPSAVRHRTRRIAIDARPPTRDAGYAKRAAERLRLRSVAGFVDSRRMQVDSPIAGRGEHETDREGVGHGHEAEATQRAHGIGHPSQRHDQIEVIVGTPLYAEQARRRPIPRRRRRRSPRARAQRARRARIRPTSRPNNGKDGEVQIAFLLFPRSPRSTPSVPTRCCNGSPAPRSCSSARERGEVRTDNGYLGLTVDADARRGAGTGGAGGSRRHGHPRPS